MYNHLRQGSGYPALNMIFQMFLYPVFIIQFTNYMKSILFQRIFSWHQDL